MRKRSKYRPRQVLLNPVGYVMESISMVSSHAGFMLDLKIKNHAALAALTQDRATRQDIDTLIAMVNVVEGLYRLGFGKDYSDVVKAGLAALRSVGARDKFILRAAEMSSLNEVMELHDAQLEVITLKDMNAAIALVHKEFALRRMTPIKETA